MCRCAGTWPRSSSCRKWSGGWNNACPNPLVSYADAIMTATAARAHMHSLTHTHTHIRTHTLCSTTSHPRSRSWGRPAGKKRHSDAPGQADEGSQLGVCHPPSPVSESTQACIGMEPWLFIRCPLSANDTPPSPCFTEVANCGIVSARLVPHHPDVNSGDTSRNTGLRAQGTRMICLLF